jgi:hypothetical protein
VPRDAPLRLAFVGQRTYFEPCTLQDPAAGVEPAFFDLRPSATAGELRDALAAWAPDAVIAFRPDLVPPGALHGLGAARIGWLTEPLPRPGIPAADTHPDLGLRLETLDALDASQFDRIVCFDPTLVETVETVVPVWRSVPIPVSDRLFAPVGKPGAHPRLLFVGRSTAHREAFLGPLKHEWDLRHLAHGVTGERLRGFMADADVAVNLHNEPYPTFENRVQSSMAAGLLVLSEPLHPRFGLLPGVDHLEAAHPDEMYELVARMERAPRAFRAMRLAGRRAAERFRASTVLPALVRDALADVRRAGPGVTAPA